MHLPVPKAGLIGLSAIFAVVAALAVFIYSSGNQEAEAATYNPTSAVKFCNALSASFPDSKPFTDPDLAGAPGCVEGVIPTSTARNYTVTFSVGAPDSNFGSSVITNVPGTTSADAALANGTKVGGLRSDVTLGLLNGTCGTALIAEFILFDSATTGAPITPAPEGTANRWTSIVTDATFDELGDSNSPAITSNLSIYETLFTPDGGSYIPPLARYTGLTKVPLGGDWQLLSFFQVNAGALDAFATNANDEPHIFGRVSHAPASGSVSLSILNDPTAVAISISPIHDFCTPLVVQTMLLGTTSGGTRYTTPAAAGTIGISNFSYGQRDADNDGIENAYDTCPLTANAGTDADNDGIDGACDPTPAVNTGGGDHDGDGYANRQDNCPLISNSPNTEAEASTANKYITVAPDGGPKGDSIGDPCDPAPTTAFGQGAFVEAYNLAYKCIGAGPDADGDGICAAQDINDAVVCAPTATKCGFATTAGMDSEYKNGSGTQGDHGDGWGGNHERYLGTDPLRKCGVAVIGQASDTWPADLATTGGTGPNNVNISDVLALKAVFGGAVPAVDARFDLVPSKTINISDVLAVKGPFGKSCTP